MGFKLHNQASSFLFNFPFPMNSSSTHFLLPCNPQLKLIPSSTVRHSIPTRPSSSPHPWNISRFSYSQENSAFNTKCLSIPTTGGSEGNFVYQESKTEVGLEKFGFSVKRGLVLAMLVVGVVRCQGALAADVSSVGLLVQRSSVYLKGVWPKILQVLHVFKEQGLILAALLGLSAFFSMAETSITTLSPWKVRELAEKEGEDGVFKMLRTDVTRFLTTILIGTTVVNIGATALVTEAATAIFGEAGISAATGVMTVAILLLTEITPKSIQFTIL